MPQCEKPLPPRQPAVTLIVDLQNLIRSTVDASGYSQQVSSKQLKPFMRYRVNKIRPGEWTNAMD